MEVHVGDRKVQLFSSHTTEIIKLVELSPKVSKKRQTKLNTHKQCVHHPRL